MRMVRRPARARLAARWQDREVLPSPETGLETITTLSLLVSEACSSIVRALSMASFSCCCDV